MRPSILSMIVLSTALLAPAACTNKTEEIRPAIGPMTESVYASVTVQPEDRYEVFATNAGILDEVFVEEGDTVQKGQLLARISTSNPQLNREEALLNVNLAREKYRGQATALESLEDEIRSAEAQLKVDSLNYFRQKSLWEQNIGSRSELESRKLRYEQAQTNLDVLRKRLRQTELELKTSYKQAQNALQQAEANLSDYFLRSRMDGKVYALYKQEGELIGPQEPLALIGKKNEFVIDLLIDEVDVARIEPGQTALVTLDAYQGRVFEAVITRIYPLKDERTQTFTVEGRFTTPPPVLYAGLSGEANIVLSEKKNVISIPLEYLLEGGRVKTEDGEVDVEVGMQNIERVEIVSGIDTATVILKP